MIKPGPDTIKIINNRVKEVLRQLGLHIFAFVLVLILLDLILGGLVFYKYVYSAINQPAQINEKILRFDYKTYQSVIDRMSISK